MRSKRVAPLQINIHSSARFAAPRSGATSGAAKPTSLEGAIRGARRDEQERLLSDQLWQLLRDGGRFSLVDIAPIAREAQANNLQACGGCDIQLARRIGAELAITGTVQKVSNNSTEPAPSVAPPQSLLTEARQRLCGGAWVI